MEIDAATFFAAIDEARDPAPVMSREEAVIVAILNHASIPGRCAACGADTSKLRQARWCDECYRVSNRLALIAANTRLRNGRKRMDNCVRCGKRFPMRKGPSVRCVKCQAVHERQENAARMRERRRQQRQEARAEELGMPVFEGSAEDFVTMFGRCE